jgi:signal transduction histidine kinase
VPEALEALVGQYRASSPDAHASLALDGDLSLLEGPAALAAVRVAQEALTNVAKHAPGATVRVELRIDTDPGGAVLRIRDSGAPAHGTGGGALAGSGGGFGLRGMRERAQILGGSLEAGPDGTGWRVELRLPPAVDGRVPAVPAVVPA